MTTDETSLRITLRSIGKLLSADGADNDRISNCCNPRTAGVDSMEGLALTSSGNINPRRNANWSARGSLAETVDTGPLPLVSVLYAHPVLIPIVASQ